MQSYLLSLLPQQDMNNIAYCYHERIPDNIFPFKLRQVVVLVQVYLSTYHDGQSKQTYQYTDKQPTSKTNPVSLVEFE